MIFFSFIFCLMNLNERNIIEEEKVIGERERTERREEEGKRKRKEEEKGEKNKKME